MALEDHSPEHSWWLDPATGEIDPRFESSLEESEPDPSLIPIEPLPTGVGYADMEAFVAAVRDPRARDLLERSIAGRGAFRRFKDTLLDYPELRRAWFQFHDSRGERRAIEWLIEHELIEPAAAQEAIARREDLPPGLPGLLDAQGLARRLVEDLRRIYRQRLKGLVIIGPWARGGTHPDSPVSLVVVLDGVLDRWAEKRRMERVMWRYSVRHDTVVTAVPLSPEDLELPLSPQLAADLQQGVHVE
ncbi:MAG: UPF0158 family protein [Thermoleophilaceae bacterium]|jgi:hypothetical protein